MKQYHLRLPVMLAGAFLVLALAAMAIPTTANAQLLEAATLENGDYGNGASLDTFGPSHGGSPGAPGVVDSADGVTFTPTEADGRSNGLINWTLADGDRDLFRAAGTVSFLFRADRGDHATGWIMGDNYGFDQHRNGQGTFAVSMSRVLNGPGDADDQVVISWSTWHNYIWVIHDPVTLAYDQWYMVGLAWGGPDNNFEIWVDGGLCSANSAADLPWGAANLGTGSATNLGLGDNHERGYDAYGSAPGVTFADIRIWRGYRALGDTEGNFDCQTDEVELAIAKELTGGPAEIGIAGPAPTEYSFEIVYSNPDPAAPVRIIDTVPAEFRCLDAALAPSAGAATCAKKGRRGNGANRIVWDLDAGVESATLVVQIETVPKPGRGRKTLVYKPAECGPLTINEGATAYEVDPVSGKIVEMFNATTGLYEPVIVVGPSNPLHAEAVAGAKDCDG